MNGAVDWVAKAASEKLAFSQVREDPQQDLELLRSFKGPVDSLMIASGGCTTALVASLIDGKLRIVDPNPAQLALAQLKLLLLGRSSDERRALLGHLPMPAEERRASLNQILGERSLSLDMLGDSSTLGALGPDQVGRYERVFSSLQGKLQDQREDLRHWLATKVAGGRRRNLPKHLGDAIRAAFSDVFDLPKLVRIFGAAATANPARPFPEHFSARSIDALESLETHRNSFLWQVFLGREAPGNGADWLDLPAKALGGSWPTFAALDMTTALQGSEPESLDFLHLSNILDWLPQRSACALLEESFRALRPGGIVFIRQLNSCLELRAASRQFVWDEAQGERFQRDDRSYFYRAHHVGRKP